MTVHSAKLLTNEEWGSLIEVAVSVPDHLAKLASVRQISLDQISLHHVSVAHVAMIENDSRTAGDGMMRITEIE